MEDVDVLVPTRDTRETTLKCVASVIEAGDAGVRCIVVDNASSDCTADVLESRWPAVTVIRSERNLGYGTACNMAARNGTAEFLLILNSDAMARVGAISSLVEFLRTHPDYVVASGRLVDAGTERFQFGFAIRGFPSLAGQFALLLGLERYWPGNPVSRRELMLDFDFSRTQGVDGQPAGACLMCRRSVFEQIGGFDTDFFYWFEDVDLVRRLAVHGRIAYVHDAVFDHLGGATFRQWPRSEVVVARHDGLLRYFEKHHSRLEVFALRSLTAALAALRIVPLLVLDRRRARAYINVLKQALHRG